MILRRNPLWTLVMFRVLRGALTFTNHHHPSRTSFLLYSPPAIRPAPRRLWSSTQTSDDLESKIKLKGDEIRKLKESGADRTAVAPLVEELLALKAQLNPPSTETAKDLKKEPAIKPKAKQSATSKEKADEESDFITARSTDYSKWYNDLIRVTGLAENSPVRGCMVIKPWGMALWDAVRIELDGKIKEHGAENAYFPLLIPKSFLSKEAEHVDGFAKECAVVTHHRLRTSDDGSELIADPDALLEEPLIIRPTSETMIWYMFKNWIQSYRDLPLKINQWANVMRWEMRTRSFLRTSEFLWQEGHTAHATAESANNDAKSMLERYADLCQDLLAIPVIKGVKSPSERFAGASETYTIEALMQNGWALQSGTSHFLGQSFGKAFDVTFQDENGQLQDVWGTSWGVSTRLLGALIMTHSDDAGLVLPPRVSPIQVVIVPIPPKKSDVETQQSLNAAMDQLASSLKAKNLRVKVDDREYVRSGAKFFEWERKGVPLRIEIGPRDVKQQACVFKYRAGDAAAAKQSVELSAAADAAASGLERMQEDLFNSATKRLHDGINVNTISYEEMKDALMHDEASVYPGTGLFLVPWKCDADNEAKIKEECKATIRCYPLKENERKMYAGHKCFYSGDDATHMALFGRAF